MTESGPNCCSDLPVAKPQQPGRVAVADSTNNLPVTMPDPNRHAACPTGCVDAFAERINNWYSATVDGRERWPALTEDHHTGIAVVGGGITGVATALSLAERGYPVTLLEANRIGWGATGRNGGQVTGSLSGDQAMLRQWRARGFAQAEDWLWELRWRGQQLIRRRVEQYGIDCDLKTGHIQAAWKASHMAELEALHDEAIRRDAGLGTALLSAAEVSERLATDRYVGGLYNDSNLHLHSLKLCLGEARAAQRLGVRIHEQTPVLELPAGSGLRLKTPQGIVHADAVVLCGNAYHRLAGQRLRGMLFPAALANLVTEPLTGAAGSIIPADVAVYDTRFVLDYYRKTADNRLMFGGGANYSGRGPRDIGALLRPSLEETFPVLRGIGIDYAWTGLAGITINRIPQLGRLAGDVYFAQGFSGHGMATAHILGELIGDAVGGTMSQFDRIASLKSVRLPLGQVAGQGLLTLGMYWYLFKERFR